MLGTRVAPGRVFTEYSETAARSGCESSRLSGGLYAAALAEQAHARTTLWTQMTMASELVGVMTTMTLSLPSAVL
jgi:hypothetical protein